MNTEAAPLRPVGTEFEQVVHTPTGDVTERYKVIGHLPTQNGDEVELLQVISRTAPLRKRSPTVLK
jgi:hypothetical protein